MCLSCVGWKVYRRTLRTSRVSQRNRFFGTRNRTACNGVASGNRRDSHTCIEGGVEGTVKTADGRWHRWQKLDRFRGRREAKESAEDFLDDVEFAAEQLAASGTLDDKMMIRLFRQHLEDKSLDFWLGMVSEDKKEWQKGIAGYVEEAKAMFRDMPNDMSEVFAISFIRGLSDPGKKAAVSFAIREGNMDSNRAVELVKASYWVVGELDVFAAAAAEKALTRTTTTTEVVAELLKYLKGANMNRSSTQSGLITQMTQKSAMDGQQPTLQLPYNQTQRVANPYVTCYNCGKAGHYSNECGDPAASWEGHTTGLSRESAKGSSRVQGTAGHESLKGHLTLYVHFAFINWVNAKHSQKNPSQKHYYIYSSLKIIFLRM
ncbi:hypothetical protein BGX38DRAFT_1296860 [Terfezia claveryi]|nr:hypothetical protein BGX38DRAFT_1296860 [Terfezia claveryi]